MEKMGKNALHGWHNIVANGMNNNVLLMQGLNSIYFTIKTWMYLFCVCRYHTVSAYCHIIKGNENEKQNKWNCVHSGCKAVAANVETNRQKMYKMR